MEYVRNYTHRTFGVIGSVTFDCPKGTFKLNGAELPESSVAHLMTFALQTLQDAYAGAKSTDEALGAFNGKLDKLHNGTIGTRGGGDGVDERTRVARSIMRGAMKAQLGAKSPAWATFTGLSDDEQNTKVDANLAANEKALAPVIDAKLAELAERRARTAGLAGTVTIKM